MMDILSSIASNGAIQLSLTFIYTLCIPLFTRIPATLSKMLTGILFGIFIFFNMLNPIVFAGGIILDPRNVMIMVGAMLGGFRAGFLAFAIAFLYRYSLGGEGLVVGGGSMLTAFVLGSIYHHLRPQPIRFDRYTLLMGLLVAFESLFWTALLPNNFGWRMLSLLGMPVLLTYPVITCVLVWLIASSYRQQELIETVHINEQQFRAVFEQAFQFLVLLKPDGTVVRVSSSLLQTRTFSGVVIVGQKMWEIVPSQNQLQKVMEELRINFERAVKGEQVRYNIQAGQVEPTFILDVVLQPIHDNHGQITYVLLEASDITAQLTAQANGLTIQFERERNEILQQLIADASHHLRTPLTILRSSTYLLQKHVEKLSTAPSFELPALQSKIDNQFLKLDSAMRDLNDIVADLISMMKLDSPESQQYKVINFVPFAQGIVSRYHDVVQQKHLHLEVTAPNCELLVRLAHDSFELVIANLIENAIRYTPANGTITITISQTEHCLFFRVQDSGIGIPSDDLPRIFDRFYRASNATEQSSKGTGLGLAIVKKTVENHQGRVLIDSQLGIGTNLTIELPLVSQLAVAL